MRVFLSYASKDRALAERVCRVLETEGHDVFFDRDDLGGGDAFGQRIRTAIRGSHVLVYLISQASITPPSYALTELSHAIDPRPSRGLTILPVRTDATPIASVPAALRAYTILEPQGDVPADIASAVDRIARRHRGRRLAVAGAAALAAVVLAGGYMARGWFATTPAVTSVPPAAPASTGDGTGAPGNVGGTTPSGPASPVPGVAADGGAIPGMPGAPGIPAGPDAIEALNRSILERTPPERRVTLIGMPGGDGWTATLIVADQSVTEIKYRLDGETGFTSTGSSDLPSMFTGRPQPNTQIQMRGEFWKPRQLAVTYTDVKGREHGPFQLAFEPRTQFVRFTRQTLNHIPWITFQKEPGEKPLAYFTALLSFKAAFREIRYSVDSMAFDRVYPMKFEPSEGWPGRMVDDVIFVELPPAAKRLAVKVTYVDGTSDSRTLDVR